MGSPIRPDLPLPARILSPDEFDQVQGLTASGVRAAKLPLVAPPFTPRPVAESTAPQNTVHPSRLVKPTTVGGVLGQQVQGMVDNPAQTAASFGATMNPVGGLAAVGFMGKDLIEYAAQKAAEMTLDPATRALAEQDPERITGASAAVQGGMLALFPILHRVGKSASGLTDVGDGMMEAGAAGLRGMDGIPRTADAAVTMAKLNSGAAPTASPMAPSAASPSAASPTPPESPRTAQLRSAVTAHVQRVADSWKTMFHPIADQARKTFAPDARGPESAEAGTILRATTGQAAGEYEQAAFKLDEFRRAIEPLPEADKLGFIDAIEGGRSQASPEFQAAADEMRATLDRTRDAIRALGTGKLESFIENYFPHIWQDPERAAEAFKASPTFEPGEGAVAGDAAGEAPASPVAAPSTAGQSLADIAAQGGRGEMAGKRPFEGSKSFLKKRTIPTTLEGMQQGLMPVTTNPVDLTLLKLREMQRYLTAHQSLNEMKAAGLVKFVRAGELPPDGYRPIDDKIATVFGPRTGGISLPEGAMVPGEAPAAELVSVRESNGRLRRNLSNVPDAHLEAEWRRLAELNAHEEGLHASVQESGYRADYEALPRTEKLGAKGQEDLPDADGAVDPDVLASHNEIVRDYRKSTIVRAARDKAMKRIEAEMASRPSASDFTFGANEYRAGNGLTGMRPMTPGDVTVHGMRIMGAYHAPEPVATVVNNYLSPGLRGNAIYDAFRGLGNSLNLFQLGFSAFHLGMTSIDATVSRVALGLEHAASGAPLEAAAKIASAPFAAFPAVAQGTVGDYVLPKLGIESQWGLGAKIRAAYLDPAKAPADMVALANAVKEAGGRVTQDSFYKNSAPERMMTAWHAGEYGKAARLSIPALAEKTMEPIMEHIVPLQKLQVFGELAQRALTDLPPEATLTQRRAALQGAWDSADNRMGQLIYDNLFWNKTLKDLTMLAVRSVGWNLGTIREIGGGALDLAGATAKAVSGTPAELTHRAAYFAALPMTLGAMGAAYQYLRTGEGPKELKDYFYPKTGELDADGNPERVQMPSYMKDLTAYAGHPWDTVKHKVAPVLSALYEMLQNEDYYGDQIRNADDPAVKQVAQEAKFVAQQVVPFSIRNYQESTKRGDQSAVTKFGNWFGVTPAPRREVRSDAQNQMADYLGQRKMTGATPEDAEARQSRAEILSGLRGTNGIDLEQAVTDAIERHQLTPPELVQLLHRAGTTPMQEKFKRLTLAQAVDVFKKSTPREQALFAEAMLSKLDRMHGSATGSATDGAPDDAPTDAAGVPVGH